VKSVCSYTTAAAAGAELCGRGAAADLSYKQTWFFIHCEYNSAHESAMSATEESRQTRSLSVYELYVGCRDKSSYIF